MNMKGKMMVVALIIVLLAAPTLSLSKRIVVSNSIQQKQAEEQKIRSKIDSGVKNYLRDNNVRVYRGSTQVKAPYTGFYKPKLNEIHFKSPNPPKTKYLHEGIHAMADQNKNLLWGLDKELYSARMFENNPDLNKELEKNYVTRKPFVGKTMRQSLNEETFVRIATSYYENPRSVKKRYPNSAKRIMQIFGVKP